MKVLIAGGGIGGLTTALCLHRAGIEVEVFERPGEVRELGVGINMLPHAVKELAGLGLLPGLDRDGDPDARADPWPTGSARRSGSELRGIDAGYDVPQISIHRGKLQGVLHEAVRERTAGRRRHPHRLPRDRLRENRDGVAVAFGHEGRIGAVGSRRAILLIGADGIHSAVRAAHLSRRGPPVWNGIMLWRGATQWPVWRDGRTMVIAGGNVAKFVYYPIRPNPAAAGHAADQLGDHGPHRRHGASPPRRREDWSRPGYGGGAALRARPASGSDFVDPVALIEATRPFYEYPNCDRDPLPRWSFGRVTLLGDAAHPDVPRRLQRRQPGHPRRPPPGGHLAAGRSAGRRGACRL